MTGAPLAVTDQDVDLMLESWVEQVAAVGGIKTDSARAIVEWHGKGSLAIARVAAGRAELRALLCTHTAHIVAEAANAFSNECAVTLADVLLRRVPVALGPCWSRECSREAASRIAAGMGWSEDREKKELEAFEIERNDFLRMP